MKNYKSVKEIANEWGITERQVRNLCKTGKISGVFMVGGSYIIPGNAVKPNRNGKSLGEKIHQEEKINNLKYNYVIVHGTFGHPGENWFPWLAEEIAKLDTSGNTQKEDVFLRRLD